MKWRLTKDFLQQLYYIKICNEYDHYTYTYFSTTYIKEAYEPLTKYGVNIFAIDFRVLEKVKVIQKISH